MGDITKNFSLSEFARCREGLQDLPYEVEHAITYRLAPKLQYLRDRIGRPIRITSGYRSEAYNARIGGSKTSRHVYGLAADIDVANMGADELAQLVVDTAAEEGEMWDQVISYPKTGGHVHVGLAFEGKQPRGEKRRKLPSGSYPHVHRFTQESER